MNLSFKELFRSVNGEFMQFYHIEDEAVGFRKGKKKKKTLMIQRRIISVYCHIDTSFVTVSLQDADKHIIKRLKADGRLVHEGTCKHSYPFCWR